MIIAVLAINGSALAQVPRNPIRIFAYYLAGNQNGPLTPKEIDYGAFSDLIHFGINVNADGSIDPMTCGITPTQSNQVISYAHAYGDKALVCLGTDRVETLRAAISDNRRYNTIHSLVALSNSGATTA